MPKYPEIRIILPGKGLNAMVYISAVSNALRRNGIDMHEVAQFQREAMEGDYNNVFDTCAAWVNTRPDEEDEDDGD